MDQGFLSIEHHLSRVKLRGEAAITEGLQPSGCPGIDQADTSPLILPAAMPQEGLRLLGRGLKILLFHQQSGKFFLFRQNAAGDSNSIFLQHLQHLCQRCAGVLSLLQLLLQCHDQ